MVYKPTGRPRGRPRKPVVPKPPKPPRPRKPHPLDILDTVGFPPKTLERFKNAIEVHGQHWIWRGRIHHGIEGTDRIVTVIHGIMYTVRPTLYKLLVAPIPDGCIIVCTCKYRRLCVNPSHLEVTTRAAHLRILWRRGRTRTLRQRAADKRRYRSSPHRRAYIAAKARERAAKRRQQPTDTSPTP